MGEYLFYAMIFIMQCVYIVWNPLVAWGLTLFCAIFSFYKKWTILFVVAFVFAAMHSGWELAKLFRRAVEFDFLVFAELIARIFTGYMIFVAGGVMAGYLFQNIINLTHRKN